MLHPRGPRVGPRVRVYVREGCHLCSDALSVVASVTQEFDIDYDVVDVDVRSEWRDEFSDHVPVTVVDGVVVARWFLSRDQLVHALSTT